MRASSLTSLVAGAVVGTATGALRSGRVHRGRPVLWAAGALGAAVVANELAGKPALFLRWSFLRMLLGHRRLQTTWQVGDGREDALVAYVTRHARAGDVDDVIRAIDRFCLERSFLINVGEDKGEILDRVVRRIRPAVLLELGTYCGYSALRMVRAMPPDARLHSIEFSPANARIARRILEHAGVGDRVTIVVGTLGDGGPTMERLRTEHGFAAGALDFVFVDHDKDAYLPDLRRILDRQWLHPGSVVVADNVRIPGAPAYRQFMRMHEGRHWRTTEHEAHTEYQSLVKDLVLESEYLG